MAESRLVNIYYVGQDDGDDGEGTYKSWLLFL